MATHARLAQELPPHSERQVRSALARLRKARLIDTDHTRIRLTKESLIKVGAGLPAG